MEDALARALEHSIMRTVEGDSSFFKLAHALSCTTKALAAAAKLDARFPFVIAYQLAMRWRSKFWLQGIPSAVTLFEGNVPPEMAAELPPAQVARLGFDSLLYDRSDFSVRCNNWSDAKIDAIAASNTPNDLPPGVPKRAAIFVARCRAVAQAVAVGSNVTCFTECAHRGCRRRFFMAPATLPSSADLGGILGDASAEYWALLAGRRTDVSPPRRFCSPVCAAQYNREMDAAIPKLAGKALNTEPDPGREMGRQTRVANGLRLSAKRNEEVARQLRGAKPVFTACSKSDYRQRVETLTRQLNLDFLLLYTSSVIAESKSLSQGLLLAGEKPQWRNRPRFVAASVKKIIALYDKYHRDPAVVLHNLLLSSRLLQKAKENSLSIMR
jgi:hypothetical protein